MVDKVVSYCISIGITSEILIKSFQCGATLGVIIGIIYFINRV